MFRGNHEERCEYAPQERVRRGNGGHHAAGFGDDDVRHAVDRYIRETEARFVIQHYIVQRYLPRLRDRMQAMYASSWECPSQI